MQCCIYCFILHLLLQFSEICNLFFSGFPCIFLLLHVLPSIDDSIVFYSIVYHLPLSSRVRMCRIIPSTFALGSIRR